MWASRPWLFVSLWEAKIQPKTYKVTHSLKPTQKITYQWSWACVMLIRDMDSNEIFETLLFLKTAMLRATIMSTLIMSMKITLPLNVVIWKKGNFFLWYLLLSKALYKVYQKDGIQKGPKCSYFQNDSSLWKRALNRFSNFFWFTIHFLLKQLKFVFEKKISKMFYFQLRVICIQCFGFFWQIFEWL